MAKPRGSSLVADPDAFLGYRAAPLFRDAQLAELGTCFAGDVPSLLPVHAWVYGSPGVGKTLCVGHVVERSAKPAGFLCASVNCRTGFTFLGVIEGLLDAIRPLRSPQRSRERQLAILRQELSGRRAVIALDEIDVLPHRDIVDLLHHLTAFPMASLICVASSRETLLRLPEAVVSRLAPRQVLFPRYRPEEMYGIVKAAARRALAPRSWSEESLQKIVEHAYGDARRALALLRHAVQRADDAGATVLGPEHLVAGTLITLPLSSRNGWRRSLPTTSSSTTWFSLAGRFPATRLIADTRRLANDAPSSPCRPGRSASTWSACAGLGSSAGSTERGRRGGSTGSQPDQIGLAVPNECRRWRRSVRRETALLGARDHC